MKRLLCLLALTSALPPLRAGVLAQAVEPRPIGPVAYLSAAPASGSKSLVSPTNGSTPWLKRLPAPTSTNAPPLKPGVFKAVPYTALVLVPAPGLDPSFAHTPGASGSRMPVFKPELRLVPYQPAPATTNTPLGRTVPPRSR